METNTAFNQSGHGSSSYGRSGSANSDFYSLEMQHVKQAEWINIVLKSGLHRAFPLLALKEMSFSPSVGISLIFRNAMIHIQGRQLGGLYRHCLARKVKEIREFGQKAEHEYGEEELVITAIEVQGDHMVH